MFIKQTSAGGYYDRDGQQHSGRGLYLALFDWNEYWALDEVRALCMECQAIAAKRQCAVCKVERGLSPELCTVRQYRADFHPALAGAIVTTWQGQVIGTITRAHVHWHNFGGRMVSLQVQGTNGARYYGRASWDGGDCVSLRRVKVV